MRAAPNHGDKADYGTEGKAPNPASSVPDRMTLLVVVRPMHLVKGPLSGSGLRQRSSLR